MKIIKITKADLDENNKYKKAGIGTYDNYEDVSVEIDENLGYVTFEKGLYVNGSITTQKYQQDTTQKYQHLKTLYLLQKQTQN